MDLLSNIDITFQQLFNITEALAGIFAIIYLILAAIRGEL